MSAMTQVPPNHPLMIAWEAYKAGDDYANSLRWAVVSLDDQVVSGSLWGAFMAGFNAAEPVLTVRYDVLLKENRRLQGELAALHAEIGDLRKSGNALSLAAQTTGGTAGRDEGLVTAIDGWTAVSGPQANRPKTFEAAP